MLKKFITVAGIADVSTSIVDGDREVNQGDILLLVLDMYIDPRVVFGIIKRQHPDAVLVSTGLISIRPNCTVVMLEGNEVDQSMIDSHTLGDALAVMVTINNCFYTRNITSANLINTTYPLGKLPNLLKLVSAIA